MKYKDISFIQRSKKIIMGSLFILFMCLTHSTYASNSGLRVKEFTQILKVLDKENRLDITGIPDTVLTRQEAAAIITKLMGYEGIAKDYKDLIVFEDVIDYQGEINLVKQLGIMGGVSEKTFNPLGTVSKAQGDIIFSRIQDKLNRQIGWNHAFYALSSSSQMELIPNYDGISFGWSQIGYDKNENKFMLESRNGQNDFKIPQGFHIPMDLAKASGVETYLMVFFEDKNQLAKSLLTDTNASDKIIEEIVNLCNEIGEDNIVRSFDGVTIDFENFVSEELKVPYVKFLSKLNEELKKNNKKLNVALQPTTHFKGYDYKGIGQVCDKVILMAHDYAPKSLTKVEQELGIVMTPLTPINEIFKSLSKITDPISGVQDKNKIVLQISYASTQWQVKNGKVINEKPYTPTYDKIYERLNNPSTNQLYSDQYQNPYATYEQDGIKNIIWYENEKSVQAKIDLAKFLGVEGISYWRLGSIPK